MNVLHDEFSVETSVADGTRVVVVLGEVDLAVSDRLREVLLVGDEDMVVDLTGVSFLDSSGIAALLPFGYRSLKSQIKSADRAGVRFLVMLGTPACRACLALCPCPCIISLTPPAVRLLAKLVLPRYLWVPGAANVMYGHGFRLNPDNGPILPIDMAGPDQAAACVVLRMCLQRLFHA